jgi:YesN/AraC family two-component response regulator
MAKENQREMDVRGTEDFPLSFYHYNCTDKVIRTHWHPDIEILYVHSGEVILYVSDEKLILKEGDICFVNPGEVHGLDLREQMVDYYAAVFVPTLFQFREKHFLEQEFFAPLQEGQLRFPRIVNATNEHYEEMRRIVDHMFRKDGISKVRIFTDLTMIFCELLEHSMMETVMESAGYRYTEAIKRCICYMEANYSRKITLTELANEVHMSPNYLCSYFKKYTGISPFTQLHYVRVKTAENMLLEGDESIVSVAEACGFENVSFFIRKFKELTGFTPSNYRKRMRG